MEVIKHDGKQNTHTELPRIQLMDVHLMEAMTGAVDNGVREDGDYVMRNWFSVSHLGLLDCVELYFFKKLSVEEVKESMARLQAHGLIEYKYMHGQHEFKVLNLVLNFR